MSNLAVSNKSSLNIDQFDMANFFYTDSFLFNRLTLSEKVMSVIETFFAFFLLLFFLPIMLLMAAAIKLTMGGSVFYTQTRVGRYGNHFSIIKFRTMIENAEAESGPRLSSIGDPRVTKLGKFLRASHFDELPQLMNVIHGDMSFIGPRPERPEFVETFEREIVQYTRRREVKPGITGLAQICLPYDATAKEKLEYDVFYIDNQQSILFNFIISYYTALKMMTFFRN
ncbi:MAG: sugar transferase [Bacteriovorax sp.]|nr:sugar transferase [Bacteriovorax sp.]